MGGKLLTLYILVVIFSGTMLYTAQTNVEAVDEPVVTIRFLEEEEEQIADVSPGEHGTVNFPGTIMVETSSGSTVQDVLVALNGSTGLNWPVTIVPSQVVVKPGAEEIFSVKVYVPPETSYYIRDTLTVSGTAQPNPGSEKYDIGAITGSIRIAQFYKFALECDEPSKDVGLGEQVQFSFKIWNYGNGRDTFVISILDLDELSEKGFTVTMGINTVDVEEKSQMEVAITVKAPTGISNLGTHVIEVETKSEQQERLEGTAFPKTYPINVNIIASGSSGDNSDKEGDGESTPGFEGAFSIVALAIMFIIYKRRSS